ncbi:uncharacterized protein LOC120556696 isoform X2 [Perca fluviatilis]|uniref:uncharacterized protein LOC120556696 isoform X2 n=1 Tax=Perca fluviatilis TaxID=8168 RepID=UPI0019638709|nr:uncharacterized protein LOC120556696 isoform X2 [Perca fluviatilis]
MNSCVVKLCIFVFLTEGTLGAEITINVRTSASVTCVCSTYEDLRKCSCPSLKNCHIPVCTGRTDLVFSSTTYNFEKYFKLSELQHSDSGLYACYNIYYKRIGQKYRLNVLEDQDPTVVIGTVGQSIVLSGSIKPDIMAASEKHWCRLDNADVCQPNTVMGPENGPRGDFQILDTDSSFSLEKRNVTHNDSGSYRLTLIFPNQTKVYVVKLQVKDKGNHLQIIPIRDKPKLELTCQYSQELQNFSKSWLCDNSECPDTARSVDDRFKSALLLTLDHAPCSKIKQFKCVAKTSGSYVDSNVYFKPYSQNDIANFDFHYRKPRRLQIYIYKLLKLSCYNARDYGIFGRVSWHNNPSKPSLCRVSGSRCITVTENIKEYDDAAILEMCVMPNNNETTYRCTSNMGTSTVTLSVVETPDQRHQRISPWRPEVPYIPRGQGHNIGILIVVVCIVLIIGIMLVTATKCNGQKLKRLFERRTPLAAVDIHANMYANAIAQYYNQRCDVPPPDKQGEGDDKEISSSSDDAFEELPVRPKRSSMKKETDYVRVKPGGATRSLDANALLKDSSVYGLGRKGDYKEISSSSDDAFEELPVRPKRSSMKKETGPKRSSMKKETDYVRVKPGGATRSLDANALLKDSNVYGLGRKGEVGYTSKSKTDKVVKKQGEVGAQSSSGRRDKEDDDDYEVNYISVTIKPKH